MSDPALQDVQQNIRIPLVNVGDSRLTGGDVGAFWDQLYLNCFPLVAVHPVTGESDFSVSKRPGIDTSGMAAISSLLTNPADPVVPLCNIGITQLSDVCIGAFYEPTAAVIDIIQYRPFANTFTKLGSIAGASPFDKVYFTEAMFTTSEIPGLMVTWCKFDYSTSKGYFAQSAGGVFAGGSLTEIVDVAYPSKVASEVLVGPMQQLNGYLYAMGRSGKIYQSSNVYNIVAWGSRIIETYSYPDKAVGIFRFKHHLVGFSDTTIEFFNDTGARGDGGTLASNLERTEQAFIKFGAISAKYVKNIDDILYWCSSSDTTTTGVWKMDGYTPVKISTYKQDQQLNSALSNIGGLIGGSLESMSILGQKHIIINGVSTVIVPYVETLLATYPAVDDPYFSSSDASGPLRPNILAYCLDTKCWWHFSDCSDLQEYAYLPCSYFNRAASNDYSKQYILKVSRNSTSSTNDSVFSKFIYVLDPASANYVDTPSTGIYYPQYSVLSCVQTNTIDQNTIVDKYLKKTSLVMDTPSQSEFSSQMEPYIYISMERNDSQGMFTPTNQKFFPIKQRTLNPDAQSLDITSYSWNEGAQPAVTNKMTVEGWFKNDNSLANGQTAVPIMCWRSDNTSSSWYLAFTRADPNWTFSFDVAAAQAEVPSLNFRSYTQPQASAPFWTAWTHFAALIDLSIVSPLGKIQLFINGSPVVMTGGAGPSAATFQTSTDGLTLGARQAGAPFAAANIGVNMSNVRVWDQIRSEGQINYFMNDQTLVKGVVPHLLYSMLDGTTTRIYKNQTPANQDVTTGGRANTNIRRPLFTRTYANNCGRVNRTAFCILHKAPMSFRAKALELTLAQGSR